ncbi:MAG: flagellar protein FlaG [Pseudomonadales bacterium]
MSEIEGIRSAARVPPAPLALVSRSPGANGSAGGSSLPPDGVAQPVAATPQPVDRQKIEESVAKIADYVQTIQRNLSFKLDDTTGQTVITVTDSQTDEVIRQIPSEYILELAQNLKELQEALSDTKGNLLEVRV